MTTRERADLRPVRCASAGLAIAATLALVGSASAAPDVGIGQDATTYIGVANLAGSGDDAIRLHGGQGTSVGEGIVPACQMWTVVPGQEAAHAVALADARDGSPLGLLVLTEWATGGRVATTGGHLATRLLVPVATIDYVGQDTVVAIRSAAAAAVRVTASLRADGAAAPAAQLDLTIQPWAVSTVDLAKDPAFVAVAPNTPHGFLGSLELVADGPIAAWSTVDLTDQAMGVWSVEALRPDDAARTLHAPLVRHRWYGYDTGIAVVNPGDQPVTVDVVYHASPALLGAQPERRHGARVVPPRGSTVFYQGPGGGHGLPTPFVGSATIEAEGGTVLAIVNDALELGVQSAAYVAQAASAGATRLLVPGVRNRLGPPRLSTGVQVHNPGTESARVRYAVWDKDGMQRPCPIGCEQTLRAGESHAFVMGYGGLDLLPEDAYGTVWIDADQPVIAVVNDFSTNGRADASAYNALPCGQGGADVVGLP